MTKKEANKKVNLLFNKWKRDFRDSSIVPDDVFYKSLSDFKKECLTLHNVVGLYEVISDKNALKMASICSSVMFTEPHSMLMHLQKTTGTY